MLEEQRLQIVAHVLLDCLLGVLLHTGINGGVYLETVTIEVIVGAVFLGIVGTPVFEHQSQILSEIGGFAGIVCLRLEVGHINGQCLDGVELRFVQITIFLHLAEDHVAAVHGGLIVASRTVFGGRFEHADQEGSLLGVDFRWALVEIGACRGFDADSLVAEIHGVEVHGQNLILGVFAFQLGGDDPLLEFDEHQLDLVHLLAAREQVLGQLLGDGAAAALVVEGEHAARHAKQGTHVHARMLVETGVLRGNQGVLQRLRQVTVLAVGAVFQIVGAQQLAVLRNDLGGQVCGRILQFGK